MQAGPSKRNPCLSCRFARLNEPPRSDPEKTRTGSVALAAGISNGCRDAPNTSVSLAAMTSDAEKPPRRTADPAYTLAPARLAAHRLSDRSKP
jgi:hypothetical protein